MYNSDLVSIIIPVYNVEAYLPKCLDTVSRQTYSNLEIILVDDGSEDNSGIICDEFAKKDNRAIVIHQTNQGAWAARNAGKRVANGKYLIFADSDDYLHLRAIEIMHENIIKDNEYDIAIIDYKVTSRRDEDIESYINKVTTTTMQQEEVISHLKKKDFVWRIMYRRELIENIWFRKFVFAEDCDFNTRVFLKLSNSVWIHQILYFYFQWEGSTLNSQKTREEVHKCVANIMLDIINTLPTEKNHLRHLFLRQLYDSMGGLLSETIGTEKQGEAIKLCKQHEIEARSYYWNNKKIKLIEKIAITLNIRHPLFVRKMKKITGNCFSWKWISNF